MQLETETQSRKLVRRYREDQPATEIRRIVNAERYSLKDIALHPAVDEDESTVCRWLNQSRDLPARKLPGIYFALKHNLGVWSCLLEQCGLIVVPKPALIVGASPARLLGHLSLSQARILDIFVELQEKKEVTPDDVRKMREIAEQLKQQADRAVAWAEQRLKEQGEKKQ